MHKVLAGPFAALALTGCASTPDVEYRYFPARASTAVTVTQTIDCNQDKTRFSFIHTPTVVTTYSSDRSRKPFVLRTKDLQSSLTDAEVKFDWFDDGRLKSVNQNSVGQGENIVKATMTFLAPVVGGAAPGTGECNKVATLGGGKPVTIVYERTIEHAKNQSDQVFELQPSENSKAIFDSAKDVLKARLPVLDFKVRQWEEIAPLVQATEDTADAKGAIPLTLNKTAVVPVQILVSKVAFWSSKIVVPTVETYALPIPRPKFFGKQAFALTLNEAGGITTMGYTSLSGTAGAFNALNVVSTTVSPSDPARAAAIKAEADVIAQTQRLAACQAKPAECK